MDNNNSNFSSLFLMLVLGMIGSVFVYGFYYKKPEQSVGEFLRGRLSSYSKDFKLEKLQAQVQGILGEKGEEEPFEVETVEEEIDGRVVSKRKSTEKSGLEDSFSKNEESPRNPSSRTAKKPQSQNTKKYLSKKPKKLDKINNKDREELNNLLSGVE